MGVFRGDFSRLINHYFPDRKLYLFDTFEGFDKRDAEVDRRENFSSATQDFALTSVDLVLSKMEHKDNCIIRKGWFPQTADGIDDTFCFVSLDCDLYQPLKSGLEFFSHLLSSSSKHKKFPCPSLSGGLFYLRSTFERNSIVRGCFG